jgi:hypothetical protein
MIQGIMGGMVTLLWALVLLLLLVYFFALLFVVMTDFVQPNSSHPDGVWVVAEYFEDVPRSLLTTFRCSFGDCSDSSGVSIIEHSFSSPDTEWLVFVFCAFGFFFWVGLFNVISAIFVESTMTAALSLTKNKKMERLGNFPLWAENISTLIKLLWTESGHSDTLLSTQVDKIMETKFPRAVLKDAVMSDKGKNALSNLDIQEEDHEYLDDILDPDNGGSVTIVDLVDGLQRLRGDPRRSDIVTIDLMIRSLQLSNEERFHCLKASIEDVHNDIKKLGMQVGVRPSP